LHRRMRPLFRMWQEVRAGFAPVCRLPKDDCGTPRRPILCGLVGRTNAAGRQPGMENPRNGRPEAYVVWQTTNPLISKNPAPGCGDSGGVGRGPGPAGVRAAPPESRRLPRRQAAVGRMCRGIRCAEVQNGCAPCPSYDLPQTEI